MAADAKKLAKKMEKQMQTLSEEKSSAEAVHVKRVRELEQQVDELGWELDKVEKQRKDAVKVGEELREQLRIAGNMVEGMAVSKIQTDGRVAELEKQLAEAQKQLAEAQKQLTDAVDGKSAASAEQLALLATKDTRLQELQEQATKAMEELMESKGHCELMQSQLTEAVAKVASLEQTIAQERGQHKEVTAQ